MRIAILTPTFYAFSGIDRVVEMQALKLAKKHEVTVFCFEGDISPKGVLVVKLGMSKNPLMERIYRLLFFMDLRKRRRTARMLEEYDVLWAHHYPMTIMAADAKRRNPRLRFIARDHGIATPELFSSIHERVYMRAFTMLAYRYLRKADQVVSVSKYLAGVLKRAGIKATYEHNTIDTKRFRAGISGAGVRKRLRLGKAPMCLYVGRISPHKGVHQLIEAYRIAKKRIPDLKLVIGGKPTFKAYAEELQRLRQGDPDIIFAGFISDDDLPAYYAAADVYTTASRWEGFDMPIPEAAACGTPTVAYDVCSHPEVTKNGILVKENDVNAFANAIVKLVRGK